LSEVYCHVSPKGEIKEFSQMSPAVFYLASSAHKALCYNEMVHVLYVRILNSVKENKPRKASEIGHVLGDQDRPRLR